MEDVDAAKKQEQQKLLDGNEFVYLGNGWRATGGTHGWRMSPGIYFKCVRCGYLMSAESTEQTDFCFCGTMSKDADAGRFGSVLGDDRIEVYRTAPKRQSESGAR